MPAGIGAYAAAGPVSGNVPPMTIDFFVIPTCPAPPSAPGTVNATAATKTVANTMSFRTDLLLLSTPLPPCHARGYLPETRAARNRNGTRLARRTAHGPIDESPPLHSVAPPHADDDRSAWCFKTRWGTCPEVR